MKKLFAITFLFFGLSQNVFASDFSITPNRAEPSRIIQAINCSIDPDLNMVFFLNENPILYIDDCNNLTTGQSFNDLFNGTIGDRVYAVTGTQDISVSSYQDALNSPDLVENIGLVFSFISNNPFNNGFLFAIDENTGEKIELNNLLASVAVATSSSFTSLAPILATIGAIIIAFGILLNIIYFIYDTKDKKD